MKRSKIRGDDIPDSTLFHLGYTMPQFYLHRLKFLGIFSFLNIYAHAEVVLDGTLGRTEVLNGPSFDIHADLGQQQGTNLFHSFQSFNLNEGEIATFFGPDTI